MVLMLLGVPVAVSLGIASIGAILAFDTSTIASAVKLMYSSMNSFVMVAVPLFFLAGVLMGNTLLSRIPVFTAGAVISLVTLPVMYPVIRAVDKIGGKLWKE
jgi:surface polysaccharide O-acyltransferase-like enzyme